MAVGFLLSASLFMLFCVSYKVEAKTQPSLTDIAQELSKSGHADFGVSGRAANDDKFYRFVTRPDIRAPKWTVKVYDQEALSPGYWFVAPYAHLKQKDFKKWNGPHIYDGTGELVWSGAPMFKHYNTYDFRTVEVGGERMASLIFRKDEDGIIFDSTYQINQTVDMLGYMPQWLLEALGDERKTNMHDFNVVDNGRRALMLTKVFENATIEESEAIGFDGNCTAKWQGFKDVDVATSEVLFEWSAHGHIDLEESTKIGELNKVCNGHLGRGGWDILHLNAIDMFPDGDYLISSRHTDALYKISHHDGSIVWRLGGVKSDFDLLGNARFSRQHHARALEQNRTHTIVSLFDNARGDDQKQSPTYKNSRGLVLSLRTDTKPMTAETLAEYEHPLGRYTPARGSLQLLENKNAFVCWSGSTLQSEHTPDGNMILEASFKLKEADSYRSYKFPWVGRPRLPPDVHSVAGIFGKNTTGTIVHVSWNGATEVSSWKMYKTDTDGNNKVPIATIAKQGFETVLSYDGYAMYVVLEALDANGQTLGRSNVQKTLPLANLESLAMFEQTQWLQDQASSGFSKMAAFLQNPAIAFFVGASSCAAVATLVWAYSHSKKTTNFWDHSGTEAYEPLAEGDEENKDLEDDTLVDDGSEPDQGEKSSGGFV